MKKPLQNFLITFIPVIITGILIFLFLTGKIIDYPRGTTQGGLIAGFGVLVIIASVILISTTDREKMNKI